MKSNDGSGLVGIKAVGELGQVDEIEEGRWMLKKGFAI